MSGNPVQDLVMQVDSPVLALGLQNYFGWIWVETLCKTWHRLYEIILAEYEWKPCAGSGDAGGQDLYWHKVYKIISAEY
jgi:hypothetical protein